MNTRTKGRRKELQAKEELETQGWTCEVVKGSSKFNKSVDFFGLFDIIAVRSGIALFVQVKSRKVPVKEFHEFSQKHFHMFPIQLWTYKNRKPFRKYELMNKEWKEIII